QGTTAVDTVVAAGTSATVTGLLAQAYTFTVKAMKGTLESSGASVTWAPAVRSVDEPGTSTVTLKLYSKEASSPKGSGLAIDGGPRNVSTATGDLASIQLVVFMNTDNTFRIGPAPAMTQYANVAQFDHNVYVSDSTYVVTSLDEWYSSMPIDDVLN